MELDSNGVVLSEMKALVVPEVEMYTFLLTQLSLLGVGNVTAAKDVSDEALQRLAASEEPILREEAERQIKRRTAN